MDVTLYSTNCPICKVLAQKLNTKNIKYNEINDIDIMISKGFTSAPMLEVDGEIMNSITAMKFVDNYQEGTNE